MSQINSVIEKTKSKDWEPLLDASLSKWDVWTGVPEPGVLGLPANYNVPNQGKPTEPIGLGDPMGIYKVAVKNGEPILNIEAHVYAGLTSKKDYANYHLTALVKFGDKKYPPRLNQKRDNGILYHCYGEHGAFWKVWKRCLEMQVQETDMGDLYLLAGTDAKARVDDTNHWTKDGTRFSKNAKRSEDFENPHGEWTRIDLYVVGDSAIHVVNGQVVMALEDAKDHKGRALTSGQIQIQSEAADCFYKDLNIRPISKFPKKVRKAAGF
ncbi:conserved hypothetical protein (DUF1080) [Formosa agariphila KMM 3901]|uniref:3-keto-alpha-glucoside-1,2-lyase/3-keto-2-hydroxy-glucal hydratase domain-containing protein n=1 Tax=Formosa agariphila (strain DSM 15362 / KCTC 12365 / LMG 23005 / KMM 3901 / M-2Alg 35-1) TaxID=1347342 RepID=T2KN51_FORAG|nr:conserved hypothetical protein (DUF1080) [Formosa agariphila KMM 3901]